MKKQKVGSGDGNAGGRASGVAGEASLASVGRDTHCAVPAASVRV